MSQPHTAAEIEQHRQNDDAERRAMGWDIGEGLRGSGRTHRMMMEAPESGAIFVVPNGGMRRYLLDMIARHRSADFAKRSVVWVVEDQGDVQRMRGHQLPILIDHSFWESRVRADAVDALLIVQEHHARFAS